MRPTCRGWASVTAAAVLTVAAGARSARGDAPDEPRAQLIRYLNGLGVSQSEARVRVMDAVVTRTQAEARQAAVREKLLNLIGGLAEAPKSLSARDLGRVPGEGLRIEKVAFQSLPGFWVTANVYVPEGGTAPPFPAVVVTPGHGSDGKLGAYGLAVTLARAGYVALAWDPIGAGERLQTLDPATGRSVLGRPTAEHCHANLQSLLVGDHVSRYFIRDAMAAVDYLASRGDVAADRIGALGCSGGGTVTAYLAALDRRVAAAAAAGYVTSFRELLPTAGPQEGEQTIPGFLAEGLDFADWVELAAPRPFAIVSTTDDMFPFEGARQTYDEARRIYGLLAAPDRLQWLSCPGGHCAIGPIVPDILRFFARWLGGGSGIPAGDARLRPEPPEALVCTPSGQVTTALGSATVQTLTRERAAALAPARPFITRPEELARARQKVTAAVRERARVSARPGSAVPAVVTVDAAERDGYRLETLRLRTEEGIDVLGKLAVPARAGRKPAVLLLGAAGDESAARGSDLDRLARSGKVVLLFQPRPTLPGQEELKAPQLGSFNLLALRAMLVGRTIVGMRVDDTLRALDWLAARDDVAGDGLSAYGRGPLGVVLLHAAALDARIARVVIEDTLVALRDVIERPLTRDAAEVVVPGALRDYDLADLALVAEARSVRVLDPKDAIGDAVDDGAFRAAWARTIDSDRALGREGRVRLARGHEGPGAAPRHRWLLGEDE